MPDAVAFYPWMTVRQTLDYCASFRARWNAETEGALLSQFRLDVRQKASHLSKGQRTQLALIAAICPEPELLVLDEPTSGLDPIVRREFIQTVIGAYQDGDPGRRTVFVSTHLISEFEGLIDEFTIIDRGREVLTLEADAARERYQKIHVRFAGDAAGLDLAGARVLRSRGRELEIVVNGNSAEVLQALRARSPETLDDRVADARRDLRLDAAAARRGGERRDRVLRTCSRRRSPKKFERCCRPIPRRLLAVVVGSFSSSHTLIAAGLLGFAFGSVALGAQSFGHEYTHRTLGLLLSQPIDRRRLFLYKVAVLSVMLVTLTATTLVMYHELLRRAASPHTEPAMLVLAAACGLFVAPCLTMLCRSTLAGVVFTIAIPGLLADWQPTWSACSSTASIMPPRSIASGSSSSGGACS